MKLVALLIITLLTHNLSAQSVKDSVLLTYIDSIESELKSQENDILKLSVKTDNHSLSINRQRRNIEALKTVNQEIKRTIDSIQELIETNSHNIVINSNQLGTKILETEQQTETKISKLGGDVEKNRLYWMIATLATLFLGGLVYWMLGKRIKSSITDVETQIRSTKASLEEESLKLDNKLVEVLETQLKLQQESAKNRPTNSTGQEDHSLALKVADEIVRMQKNISKMGSDIKGLKPLLKGIERIQNNFAANGYEMINHLNKSYDERFNIDVINFITDENLDEGTRIISSVIKPQVNYKGVLIQRAQVDVSQN